MCVGWVLRGRRGVCTDVASVSPWWIREWTKMRAEHRSGRARGCQSAPSASSARGTAQLHPRVKASGTKKGRCEIPW